MCFKRNEWTDSWQWQILPQVGRGYASWPPISGWCPRELSPLWIQPSFQFPILCVKSDYIFTSTFHLTFFPQNEFLCSAFAQTTHIPVLSIGGCSPGPAGLPYCGFLAEGPNFMGCCFLCPPPPAWQNYPVILTAVWPQWQWHLPPFP